jgi:hypothetical protein
MIMWITALVLVAATVAVGYRQGAIRAAMTFIGLLVAAVLAIPFGPMFAWLFPLLGFKSPLAPKFGAPVIAFFAISLVFKGLAAFVHRKVEYSYRYHRDDASRAVWEVMMKRVGACVGALNGLVYFLVIALLVSVFGYTTIQIGGNESNSSTLSFLGRTADDLKATQMDKVVAPFNPAPTNYFDFADTLGLLYHNRNLQDRVESYPLFAAMAQQPVYKALGADKDLQNLIKTKGSFEEILANPTVSEVMTNTDLVKIVLDMDILDFKEYLETGVSPKFSQEKLLGRWRYDLQESIRMNKALKPDVAASQWSRVKNELVERFDDAVFTAYHDNTAKFMMATNMDGRASPMENLPPVRLPNGRIVTNSIPRWATTNALASATGKWSGSAPNYLITLNMRGAQATVEGTLNKENLSFQVAGKALSFKRLAD